MKVLGLTGRKGCGKDTVFKALEQLVPCVRRLAFADALKLEVAEAMGKDLAYVEEHKQQLRGLLQHWGTEFRRELCDSQYWIKQVREMLDGIAKRESRLRVHDPSMPEMIVVLTDVRFPNEAGLVREFDGVLARVIRGEDKSDSHKSEAEMDHYEVDAEIDNRNTLGDLAIEVHRMLVDYGWNHGSAGPSS